MSTRAIWKFVYTYNIARAAAVIYLIFKGIQHATGLSVQALVLFLVGSALVIGWGWWTVRLFHARIDLRRRRREMDERWKG